MNYFELKKILAKQFEEAGIDELSDIDWIMVEITKIKRSKLPLSGDFQDSQVKEILEAGEKRARHIPLGLIFGKSEFYGREFKVSRDTLIPRLDTEILIEEFLKVIHEREKVLAENIKMFAGLNNDETDLIFKEQFPIVNLQNQNSTINLKEQLSAIKSNNKTPTILDIGTGSGAIAVTLACETGYDTTAVDISENALEIAKENAKINNADISFIQSNLFENIKDLKFDYIVSNPPYIKSDVVLTLDKEVRDHEPILALDGGIDGLDFYRKIISQAKNHLYENGMLFFEIGYDQAKEVSKLMQADFEDIRVVKDYGDNDRVVYGKLRRN